MTNDSTHNVAPLNKTGAVILPCKWHLISRHGKCIRPSVPGTQANLCDVHSNNVGYGVGMIFPTAVVNDGTRDWPAEKPPQAKRPTQGTIYALQNGYNIKIGWTSNLPQRMLTYPPSSVLLVAYPGTRKDETAIHRSMAHLTTHGREWFPVAPQLTEWVDRMVTLHGTPEQPTFGAKRTAPRQPTAKHPMRVKAYRG